MGIHPSVIEGAKLQNRLSQALYCDQKQQHDLISWTQGQYKYKSRWSKFSISVKKTRMFIFQSVRDTDSLGFNGTPSTVNRLLDGVTYPG